MEFLIELILDLAFEGILGIGESRRVSKWVRYPFLFLSGLFFVSVILLVAMVGVAALKEGNPVAAVLLWIAAIALFIGIILMFRRKYMKLKQR